MSFDDVHVCGRGVVCPAGDDIDSAWKGVLSAKSFAAESPEADGAIACAVTAEHWLEGFSAPELRRLDRVALLGVAAAEQAVADAGLANWGVPAERLALVVGVGFGGLNTISEQHRIMARDPRRISPFGVPAAMPSTVTAFGAIRLGVKGPVSTVSTACASGSHAIVEGTRLIRDGSADVVIAGGAEAPITTITLAGFARMGALSRRVNDPEHASRPFDRDRDGFVLGEGAGFLVLANSEVAAHVGATRHASVRGVGVTCDAGHITAPDPDGAERAIRVALADAGIEARDVTHVNAHGTATRLNDVSEATAIRSVFGRRRVPVTATKGSIGHLMGGAGAVEAVMTVEAMLAKAVPPTANCDQVDDEIDLAVVQGEPVPIDDGPAVTCSFGFGGVNAVLVLTPAR